MESSWGKAISDTVSAQKSAKFMWLGQGVLAVGGGAWLAQISSDDVSILEIVLRSVLGFLIGLAVAFLLVFIWNLFRAPYKQRNELIQSLKELSRTSLAALKPELQIKPNDIEIHTDITTIKIKILNYSDYPAMNIVVDVKLGDNPWKRQLHEATSINAHNTLLKQKDDRLISELLSQIGEQKLKKQMKEFLKKPTWDLLQPGKSIILGMGDYNKDFLSKQKVSFVSAGNTSAIPPEEIYLYFESQGWKEQIYNSENAEPIKVLVHAIWENEIGRRFDQIVEYQLECVSVGTGRSYTFLPIGSVN